MIEKQRRGILERARNKHFFHIQCFLSKINSHFSSEDSGLTFTVLEKAFKPGSLCLAKLSFKNKGEIKTFTDKQNGRNFSLADLPTKILK